MLSENKSQRALCVKLSLSFWTVTADIKRKTLATYEINYMEGDVHSHSKPSELKEQGTNI